MEETAATTENLNPTTDSATTADSAVAGTTEASEEKKENLLIEIKYEKSNENVILFVRRGREVWGKATFNLVARHSEVHISMRNCVVKKLVVQNVEYQESNYMEYRRLDDPLRSYVDNGPFTMHNLAYSLGSDGPCNTLKFLLWGDEEAEIQFKVELWYRLENAPEDLLVGLRETSITPPGTATPMYRHWYSDGTLDQACFWLPHIEHVPITNLKVIARRELVVFGPGVLKEITDEAVSRSTVVSTIDEVTSKGFVPREEALKYAIHNFSLRRYVDPNKIGIAIGPFRINQGADGRNLSSCVVNGCLPGRERVELRDTVGDIAERGLAFFNEVFPGLEYPWQWYHQVFVHDTGYVMSHNGAAFAGLAVLPEELLHTSDSELDVCFRKAEVIAECVAAQWFGVCIAPETKDDYWLVVGLRKWLARRFLRVMFGSDYARMQDFKESDELMEKKWGRALVEGMPDSWIHPNEKQSRRYELKAYFAVMTLASRCGPDKFQAWLSKFVVDEDGLIRAKGSSNIPSLLLSRQHLFDYFVKAEILQKNDVLSFQGMWVNGTGFPPLLAGISPNLMSTQRNVEFHCTPDRELQKGYPEYKYMVFIKWQRVPRKIPVSEYKGCLKVRIKNSDIREIQVRFDPNFTFPHKVLFPVPVEMLNYIKFKKKRDIRGVYEAIDILSYDYVLKKSPNKRKTLESCEALSLLEGIVTNREMYWELRAAAMHSMVSLVYSDDKSNFGADALIKFYNEAYSEATLPVIIGGDTGYTAQDYLVQKEVITALSEARISKDMSKDKPLVKSPGNVIRFVLDLFKRVDTTLTNPISNRSIVARLCRALGAFDYDEDENGEDLVYEACIWLCRWIKIDLRSPGHENSVLVEAVRSIVIISVKQTIPQTFKGNFIAQVINDGYKLFYQMLEYHSSPGLCCKGIGIQYDYFLACCAKRIELERMGKDKTGIENGIKGSVDRLVCDLCSPCSRVRMYAAHLIHEILNGVADKYEVSGMVKLNISSRGDMYFLDLIRNTRDNLFRSLLIDIVSLTWGYSEKFYIYSQGQQGGYGDAGMNPYDYSYGNDTTNMN